MTTKSKQAISLALAATLMLGAGVAWAQPRGGRFGGPPGDGFGPGRGPGIGPGLLMGPVAHRLELSDEQRQTIRGILEAQRETAQPWHEDMRTLGGALEEAIEAEPFDEEAVRAIARQLADVRVELAVARARTAQEVRAVLTPDQRETLGEMRAQRRQFRGEPGGPGGRGFHRRGPGAAGS